jgi:hypothetical protein
MQDGRQIDEDVCLLACLHIMCLDFGVKALLYDLEPKAY